MFVSELDGGFAMGSRVGELMRYQPMELLFEEERWMRYLDDVALASLVQNHAGVLTVEKLDAMRFRGDLYGYLRLKGYGRIGDKVHLKINGMKHPSEFNEDIDVLKVISDDILISLRGRFAEVEYRHDDEIRKK